VASPESDVSLALDTPRLHLRPWTAADLDDLHRLWTDARVRRFLWDDEVISRARARATLAAGVASFRTHGFGGWLSIERARAAVVGFCGLRRVDDGSGVEILYGLAPAAWGRGLATEAATAVLRFGFERCGLPHIVGRTDASNAASVRVLERLGMQHAPGPAGRGAVHCFTLAREAFATLGEGARLSVHASVPPRQQITAPPGNFCPSRTYAAPPRVPAGPALNLLWGPRRWRSSARTATAGRGSRTSAPGSGFRPTRRSPKWRRRGRW